jgi:hypothetical protein
VTKDNQDSFDCPARQRDPKTNNGAKTTSQKQASCCGPEWSYLNTLLMPNAGLGWRYLFVLACSTIGKWVVMIWF